MPELYAYNAWFVRPAAAHSKTIFRLPASNGRVQAQLKSTIGSHNVPRDIMSRYAMPRSQRFCPICHSMKFSVSQALTPTRGLSTTACIILANTKPSGSWDSFQGKVSNLCGSPRAANMSQAQSEVT